MALDAPNPAAGDAAGSGNDHHKRHASDVSGNKLPAQKDQAPVRRSGARHLRLVPATKPRPRKLDVRLTVSDGPMPIGRMVARLTESDLAWLIEAVERREATQR